MKHLMCISKAQIGKCGELLVQQRLLKEGAESAHLTTDVGIDLVAYSERTGAPLTLQVKAELAPKPRGGTGPLLLDWWVPDQCPADLVALVDLESERIWLATMQEMPEFAQQHSAQGYHICMYATHLPKDTAKTRPASEFEKYLLENRIEEFF